MPTWLRERGFRFGIRSADCDEPAHVHVVQGRAIAKFWLAPVGLATSGGYNRHQLAVISEIVREHEAEFLEKWRESCSEDV